MNDFTHIGLLRICLPVLGLGYMAMAEDVCAQEGLKMSQEVAIPESIGHLSCGLATKFT